MVNNSNSQSQRKTCILNIEKMVWLTCIVKLFYLILFSNILLHHVGPEVSLEVGEFGRGLEVVLEGLLVNVFVVQHDSLDDAFVQHLLVPLLESLRLRNFLVLRKKTTCFCKILLLTDFLIKNITEIYLYLVK